MSKDIIEYFPNINGVKCFFTTKMQGNMKSPAGDQNRRVFALRHLQVPQIVLANSQHGAEVKSFKFQRGKSVEEMLDGKVVWDCDGLATDIGQLALGVTYADCNSTILIDYLEHKEGIGHVSSHNVSLGIIRNMVDAICRLGSRPSNLMALIGPGICPEHYEFDRDEAMRRLAGFEQFILPSKMDEGKCFVDMPSIIKSLLIAEGIASDSIILSGICTFKNDWLYSYRRDQYGLDKPVEAGLGVVMLV